MNHFNKIVKIHIKRFIKSPLVILIWFSFPFILITIYWLVFGNLGSDKGLPKINILLIDNDKSFISKLLPIAFQNEPLEKYFILEKVKDHSVIIKKFKNNKSSAALIIPDNFQSNLLKGKDVEIQIIKNPSQYYSPLIVEESLKILLNITNRFLANAKEAITEIKKYKDIKPTDNEIAEISKTFYKAANKTFKLRNFNFIEAKIIVDNKKSKKSFSNVFFFIFLKGIIFFKLMFLSV